MKTILSKKGRVTIPKEIRDVFGLVAGQVIDFEVREGNLIGRKNFFEDSLEEVAGMLRDKVPDVDAYLKGTRGPALKKKKRNQRSST